MKKTFTNRLLLLGLSALYFTACAFTEYGNRINEEQMEIARFEEKRHKLETGYVIVLNSLELNPHEDKLIRERDAKRARLRDLDFLIAQKRKSLDQSFMEWEQKIVQEKAEKEMVDREVKENMGKNEDVEFENK